MGRYHPQFLDAGATDLPGQFVLAAGSIEAPGDWPVDTEGRWTLATHPTLRKTEIVGDAGNRVGWLLGHGVTSDGELAAGRIPLRVTPDPDGAYERLAGELTGRFILILVSGPTPRVYPDPFAMLGAVYAPTAGVVASTSGLIPLGASTPFNADRIGAVNAPYGGMYPLGLTPRDGVERILPNHFLDLSDWTLVRRWPTAPLVFDADPVTVQRLVGEATRRAIAALARDHVLQSPLTAGRDSRALLACTRGMVDRVTLFTAELPLELVGWRDVSVATAIARRFGLRHVVFRHRRARRDDLRAWAVRTAGETSEGRGWHAIRTFGQLAPDHLALSGWAGDIVRPIYWKGIAPDHAVTPQQLLTVCGVPATPELLNRASRWLTALPTAHPVTVLDLFLAEQRGGCWIGPISYALDAAAPGHVAPMCQQAIVRAMMTLPIGYRSEVRFEHDLIAREWPELLDYPFNEQVKVGSLRRGFFGLADAARTMRTAAGVARRDPPAVLRAVRRRARTSRR